MDGGLKHCIGGGDQNHPQEERRKKQNDRLRRPYKQLRKEEKQKAKEKTKDIFMQSSKEQQGEIRKVFFSDQCKEIKENNRMEKTRDLFNNIRDTKGTFHVKMGSIKDLTEAEDIKKRWQEYREELYKKDLNDSDNHDGVITHLE